MVNKDKNKISLRPKKIIDGNASDVYRVFLEGQLSFIPIAICDFDG